MKLKVDKVQNADIKPGDIILSSPDMIEESWLVDGYWDVSDNMDDATGHNEFNPQSLIAPPFPAFIGIAVGPRPEEDGMPWSWRVGHMEVY